MKQVKGLDGQTYDFPDDATQEEILGFFEPQAEKPSLLKQVGNAFKGAGAGLAAGVNKSISETAKAFGLPSEMTDHNAAYWDEVARKSGVNPESLAGQVYQGVGAAPMGLSEFVAGVPYAAAKGGGKAAVEGKGIPEAIANIATESAKRYGVGKVFKALEGFPLTRLQKAGAMGGTMAAQSAAEGNIDPKSLAATATTGALISMGGLSGEREVIRNRMIKAGASPEVATDLAGRFDPSIKPQQIPTKEKSVIVDPSKPAEKPGAKIILPGQENLDQLERAAKRRVNNVDLSTEEKQAMLDAQNKLLNELGWGDESAKNNDVYYRPGAKAERVQVLDLDNVLKKDGEWNKEWIKNFNEANKDETAPPPVVLSSTLRQGRSIQELQEELNNVGVRADVIGKTRNLGGDVGEAPRGTEVIDWFKEYGKDAGVKRYIAIDDRTDIQPHVKDQILTKVGEGFGKEQISQLQQWLRYKEVQPELVLAFSPDKEFEPVVRNGLPGIDSEPVRRSDIVSFLQEKLDLPLRVGHHNWRGALGIFKPKSEVVRTKNANDIPVVAHEIGHALQKYLWPGSYKDGKFSAEPFKPFANELNSIASKANSASTTEVEGFAEFVRLYVTEPRQAVYKAPMFNSFFDALLAEQEPGIHNILLQARGDYGRWLKQPSAARILGQISIERGATKKSLKELFSEAYTATVDDLFPLRQKVQEMTKGKELPASQDPYKLARLLRGWTGKAEAFLQHAAFKAKTFDNVGPALKEILQPIEAELDNFRVYLVARRSMGTTKKTGINPLDARTVVKQFSRFGKAADKLYTYQDNLLNYLKDGGLLDSATYAKMSAANKDYVPFYRVFENEISQGVGSGLEAKNPLKHMKGSSRDIVDPIESIIKNTYVMIQMAEKNQIGQALVKLGDSAEGLGKFVEKIPRPLQPISTTLNEVLGNSEFVKDNIPEIAEALRRVEGGNEIVTLFRPSVFTPKENIITVFNNGKPRLYQVHPDIFRAFKALDKESVSTAVKILSYPASLLRAGAVLTPEFIARNPIRDQFSAFVFSKYGYVPGYDLLRGLSHALKKDGLYWEWKKSGAEHATLVSMDRDYLHKSVEQVLHDKSLVEHLKNPVELLRVASELMEEGTRLGEFGRGVKAGASLQDAGFSAREVTLDFNRVGAKTKAMNMIIAFWNAQVQGTDRIARAFKDDPINTTAKSVMAITIPSVLLTLANYDDPRYKEIPRWQKDLFWIVMTKNHVYRVPKPFELGILFGTIPERSLEYALTKNPKALEGMLKTFATGALPGAIPTAALPFMENWANKSVFTGRNIVPQSTEDMPTQYQYQSYTTELAKFLGKNMAKIVGEDSNIASPAKIENLVRGWTGGLGVHALKVADLALQEAGVLRKPISPTPVLSDIPFIKAFVVRYPSASSESIQVFYDNLKHTRGLHKASQTLFKEQDRVGAGALRLRKDNISLEEPARAMANMHRFINSVYLNPNISPDEKRDLITQTYLRMNAVAARANDMFNKKVNND